VGVVDGQRERRVQRPDELVQRGSRLDVVAVVGAEHLHIVEAHAVVGDPVAEDTPERPVAIEAIDRGTATSVEADTGAELALPAEAVLFRFRWGRASPHGGDGCGSFCGTKDPSLGRHGGGWCRHD
jgi:hypothetical protein